jgi:aerobic-type carbon monoxide dehydrogenase small subunit (CoxS/CutS family)
VTGDEPARQPDEPARERDEAARQPDEREDRDERVAFGLTVDGEPREVKDAWWSDSLLTVLRERLGVTGPKIACGHGRCGACAVRLDGELACACLVPAAAAAGSDVATVAALTPADGGLTDVQQAFLACGATQCGYCTPGFVLAVTDLLDRNPAPTREETLAALYGNVCRCTGYGRILEAVETAAAARRGEPS